MTPESRQYIVVTPAHNEEAFIGKTAESMVAQTVKPLCWIVVSDGSTDRTEEIIKGYTKKFAWIRLIRTPDRGERNFAGKVAAFNAGYDEVRELPFDCLASLDADISFGPDYFEFLLKKLSESSKLGLVGTPFEEDGKSYDYRFTNIEHVSGACQVFRRSCFESFGGYAPLKIGGIDLLAVLKARMKGWTTRTFTERVCFHHRRMGSGNHSILMTSFNGGYHDYQMGVYWLWQVFRSAYQIRNRPYVIGGLLLLFGYIWALVCRAERPVSEELVRFRRHEQLERLKKFFKAMVCRRSRTGSA